MKKVSLVLLIMLVLICFCVSQAEGVDFRFRNGVSFGDSMETIAEKEGARGYRRENQLIYSSMELSTIGKSQLCYCFDYDSLSRIELDYNQTRGRKEDLEPREEEYTLINEGLKRKYGSPTAESKEEVVQYPYDAYYVFDKYTGNSLQGKKKEIIHINQWLIANGDDKCIAIEHILFSFEKSEDVTIYIHFLTYQLTKKDATVFDVVDGDL